ncbi:SAM-dependent methyltransferase [Actinomadura sp. SCN-SB]|uniref:SAM-dependent methyltransferase n=1 Tax=Actinomadura sp. SCN-SB TaxID=3373092 RepID=UPI0037531AB1
MPAGEWAPTGVDLATPNTARIYDYLLGGKDNYEADRRVAERLLEIIPQARTAARQNHLFIGRAVRYLAGLGVRQFVDIGSKLPASGNAHEVAAAVAPGARVVFADSDPVVLAHARALLTGNVDTLVERSDPVRPDAVLDEPRVRGLLDLDRPTAVILDRVLHFIKDEAEAVEAVARLARALPNGYVVFTHITQEPAPESSEDVGRVFQPSTSHFWGRSRAEIERIVAPLDLVEPGLTYTSEWRGDPSEEQVDKHEYTYTLAGVGRTRS